MIGKKADLHALVSHNHVRFLDESRVAVADHDGITIHDIEKGLIERKIVIGEPGPLIFWPRTERGDVNEIHGIRGDGSSFIYNLLTDKLKVLALVSEKVVHLSGIVDHKIALLTSSGRIQIAEVNQRKVLETFSVEDPTNIDSILGIELLKNSWIILRHATSIEIRNYSKKGCPLEKIIKVESGLSCMKYEPSTDKLILGDSLGRMHVVTNLYLPQHSMQTCHWHASAIKAVGTLPGGTTIVSGGKEGVVVFWKDENTRKDFCPRLDGEIAQIILDESGQYICVVFANNRFRVLLVSNFQSIYVWSSLYLAEPKQNSTILWKGNSVISGEDGMIKIVSKADNGNSLSVREINICGRNTINHQPGASSRIYISSLNMQSEYLCAVETNIVNSERIDKLKFFKIERSEGDKMVPMDTYVDPHGSSIISIAVYGQSFVSISESGHFIEWNLFRENPNSQLKWVVKQTNWVGVKNVTRAIMPPGGSEIICSFEGGLGFINIAELKMNVQIVPIKRAISKRLVRLLATNKHLIACYHKTLLVVCLESQFVLLSEQMTLIHDCVLLDANTLAVSCKAGDQQVVVTFSMSTLSPTSVLVLPTASKLLVPLLASHPSLLTLGNSHGSLLMHNLSLEGIKELGNENIFEQTIRPIFSISNFTLPGSSKTNPDASETAILADYNRFQSTSSSNKSSAAGIFSRSHLVPNLTTLLDFKLNSLLTPLNLN